MNESTASPAPAGAPAASAGATPKSREVRLGLVLYGGVSLAIYINGVVREFFEAVRGRGVYKLLKVLTDSDVVVDVVSGTSAGGINGIFLAYALCNDRDFSDSAGLWRRDGGISRLLRDPRRPADRWDSVLDSEGYYQPAIEAALRYMAAYAPETVEEPSRFAELDVYITGTDVDGAVSTQFDAAGHAIDVKEHRAVFLLKHRAGRTDADPRWPARKQPFNPRPGGVPLGRDDVYETTTYEALAKLARITSCFPAAFAPVHVRPDKDPIQSADARLQEWGGLGKDSCFLDGGLLDNKPFTYTLEAIFSRNADRRVSRKLFYVEPDPEAFQRPMEASRPNPFQAVIASLIGIPGYESISNDLKLIAQHNSKVEQYWRIVQDCRDRPSRQTDKELKNDPLYVRSRKVALSDRVIRGILRKDGRNPVLTAHEREVAAKLVKAFDEVIPEAEAPAQFERYDVLFRLRRAYHVAYRCYDLMFPENNTPGARNASVGKYDDVLRAFNRHIELLEIIRAAMESLVDDYPFDWEATLAKELWLEVGGLYARLLDPLYNSLRAVGPTVPNGPPGGALSARILAAFYEEIFERKKAIVKARGRAGVTDAQKGEPVDKGHTLLTQTDAYERGIIEALGRLDAKDPVFLAYDEFESIDARVFPIELVAGLEQKDVIETIRISPRDADKGFSRRGFSDKVAGDALYHFGGFFKRSWRSNDILWGRLDGACQLIETLLDRERLRHVVADDKLRAAIAKRLSTDAFKPATLFPRAGAKTHAELTEWFDDLFSCTPERRASALDVVQRKVELLIEATQLEIIHDDLPNVITDALEEQAEWSEVPVSRDPDAGSGTKPQPAAPGTPSIGTGSGESPGGWIFKPLDRHIDPFVAMVAAAERMQAAMRAVEPAAENADRPRNTALGRFFRQSYRVGAEKLTQDIPIRALLEILVVTLLVANKCVLAAFGVQGERIRKNLIYRLGVGLPLWAFYFVLRMLRTRWSRRMLLLGGIGVVSGGIAAAAAAQLLGYELPWWLQWLLEWTSHWLVLLPSAIIFLIDCFFLKLLGRPQGFTPAIEHTVTVSPPGQPLLARFTAECLLRNSKLEARLVDGSLRLREALPTSQAPAEVRVRRIRIGLASHKNGRRTEITSDGRTSGWRLVTSGRWHRFGCRVRDTRGIVVSRQRHRLDLSAVGDRTCAWLVVELLADQRWWWRARQWWQQSCGRGSTQIITVHSHRYFADPLERDTPAS